MRQFRGIRPRFAVLVALVLLALPAGAVVVSGASVPPSPYNVEIRAQQLLSPSSNDYGWHVADALPTTDLTANAEVGTFLLDYKTTSVDQAPEFDDVIRHRSFGKAFLIILVCGGLIRFFTSPTYLKFISEVFDPKAAF
jgi:hypothetical protein